MNNKICEQVALLLSYHIDKEPLSEQERQQLKTHLAQCEGCQRQLHELEQVDAAITHTLDTAMHQHLSTEELGAFLDNKVESAVDRVRIEKHLKQCDECRAAYEEMQMLAELEDTFEINIQPAASKSSPLAQLKTWAKQIYAVLWPPVRVLVPVAVTVLLVIVGYQQLTGPTNLADLANTRPYPYEPLGVRQAFSPVQKLWNEAMNAYTAGDYQVAIDKLVRFKDASGDSTNALTCLYLGVSYLQVQQLDLAAQEFEIVMQVEPENAAGFWYLAQVYLQQENHTAALENLERVIELGQEPYASQARELVEEINKL